MRFSRIAIMCVVIPTVAIANIKGLEIVSKAFEANETHFDETYVSYLLGIDKQIKKCFRTIAEEKSAQDSHVRHDLKSIKLSIPFVPVPVRDDKVLGFAPIGTWDHDGWTGIKEYFKDDQLGACEFISWNLFGLQINKNAIRYDVNGKMTTVSQEGNKSAGYLYTVSWYDQAKDDRILEREINCANMANDPNILPKILDLAIRIDHK
jgi:hypothetical protein